MPIYFLLSLLVNYAFSIFSSDPDYLDSERTIPELILSFGYQFEEHKVVTQDGYILTLWRIPSKLGETRSKKPAVLIMHGLLDNGFGWLYKEGKKNLPIIMAKEGYDVFIGNSRGTIKSTEHMNKNDYTWKEVSNKYWDFSFDEMGKYDFPAMVEYIRDVTGENKITYVGHSQGTLQFFIKHMLDQEFVNSRIKAFVGYAPVLFSHHCSGIFAKALDYLHIPDIFYALNMKNFWVIPCLTPASRIFIRIFPRFMSTLVWLITGFTKGDNMNPKRMPVVAGNQPGGTSTQNMLHWMQTIREDSLKMFDFGREGNLKKYGKETPPEYPVNTLKKITVPMILMGSKVDALVSEEDLRRTLSLMPAGTKFVQIEDYGHLDFIWAENAYKEVYPITLEYLKTHSK